MKKIEAIIRPERLDAIRDALSAVGIHGITISNVLGAGLQEGYTEIFRTTEYNVDTIAKIKIELYLSDETLDACIDAIVTSGRTGEIGDGKIVISPIENMIRIRTGEMGEESL